jgi:hypothetical protein
MLNGVTISLFTLHSWNINIRKVSGVLYLQENHNICKESCYICINVDLVHHDGEELCNDLFVVLVTPKVRKIISLTLPVTSIPIKSFPVTSGDATSGDVTSGHFW